MEKLGVPAPADIEILDTATVYQGYFRVDRYRLRHRLFAGGWSQPFFREVFERGHAVAVILYDASRDALVLIEQFRIGALAASRAPECTVRFNPWLVEVVAGIIDDGETAEEVARREAHEEAGCAVRAMFEVCRFVLTPGVSSETITLFCALVDAPAGGGVHGLDHEHEDIRVVVVPAAEAFGWLDAGRITNATALIALQWFRLHHAEVRARWHGRPGAGGVAAP
jgi:ADP-ribose pyrophosphatase